jgi:hypothetical protein
MRTNNPRQSLTSPNRLSRKGVSPINNTTLTRPQRRNMVRELLSHQPRIALAALPTPLEPLPRLTAHLGGPRLFVKRDDLTGLAFGGNKTRQLEFTLVLLC